MPEPKPEQSTDADRLRRLGVAAPVIQILAAALAAEEQPKEEAGNG